MSHRSRIGAAMVVAGTIAGCKSDRPTIDTPALAAENPAEARSAAPVSVTVTAKDFAFEGPASIAAGTTTIRLVNQGTEMHQAQLIKLEDGKTLEDLAEASKKPGPPPKWVKFVGGPNAAAPGQAVEATSVLEPGNYAYICFIPSPDGKIHMSKGMAKPFQVTGQHSSAELPASDVTIKLLDYDFQPSQPLTAGHHTILVENAGPQPHELVLLKLAPGKKTEDFAAWAESGMKGQPPAMPVGGVVVLEKGGKSTFTADLAAGDYGLICFVPDAKDGKMHLAHGMMKNLKIS
jgi:plastocyanin